MTYPSGNKVPHTQEDWVVYADQRGRALSHSYTGVLNIENLAMARFKFNDEARKAFITAFIIERVKQGKASARFAAKLLDCTVDEVCERAFGEVVL